MRFLLKLFFSIILIMIAGAAVVFIKQSRGTDAGVGGPLGIVVLLAMGGGIRAIWNYKSSDENSSESKDVLKKD